MKLRSTIPILMYDPLMERARPQEIKKNYENTVNLRGFRFIYPSQFLIDRDLFYNKNYSIFSK